MNKSLEKLIEKISMVDCSSHRYGFHDITEQLTQAYKLGQQSVVEVVEGEQITVDARRSYKPYRSHEWARGFNKALQTIKDKIKNL